MPTNLLSTAPTGAPVQPLFCVATKARHLGAMSTTTTEPSPPAFERLQEVLEMARGRRLQVLKQTAA